MLQTESADREKFESQMADTMSWLQDQQQILTKAPPGAGESNDVDSELEQQETLKQDLVLKMAQIQRVIAQTKEKYAEQGIDMPPEMAAKLAELERLESDLAQQMDQKEKQLMEGRQARQDYQNTLQVVTRWLGQVEEQLSDEHPQGSITEQKEKHQEITTDIGVFRPKVEALQAQADTLLTSAGLEEKDAILSTIAEVTGRWHEVHNRAEERTSQLNEAAELWQRFESTAEFLNGRAEEAESVARSEIVWADMGTAQKQLAEHRVRSLILSAHCQFGCANVLMAISSMVMCTLLPGAG